MMQCVTMMIIIILSVLWIPNIEQYEYNSLICSTMIEKGLK